MIYRHAKLEDAESIALLHAESWRIAYRGIFSDEFLDGDVFQDRKDVWSHRFSVPQANQYVLLAEDNGDLCGFVCAFGNKDPTHGTFIDNLHVLKARKRQGIGRELIRRVAHWSQIHYPGTGLFLNVLEPNLPARCFYESLGAINQGSNLWEPPGGGQVVDLLYAWTSLDSLLAETTC